MTFAFVSVSRWMLWYVRSLAFAFERGARIRRFLLLLLVPVVVHAAGTTIPERTDAICSALSLPAGCAWSPAPFKSLRGTLTIAVGDHIAEPNSSAAWPIRASSLNFTLRHGPSIQKTVQINEGSDAATYFWYADQPPCLESYSLCEQRRETEAGYTGPQRGDLLNEAAVLTKLLLQLPDAEAIAELRALAGASDNAVPYIAQVGPRSFLWSPTGSTISTTRTVDIRIKWAVQ